MTPEQRRNRRGLSASESSPAVAEATTKPSGGSKAPAKAAPARPWWWYVTPAGLANEAKYRQQQIQRINKGTQYMGRVGMLPIYMDSKGALGTSTPAQRDIIRGAAQVPLDAAKLAVNVGQRVAGGGKAADPASSPAGRVITRTERGLNRAMQLPQPEQRRPEDLFWQQMGNQFTTGVIGGVAGNRLVGANAFTQGAFKSLSPAVQQALRWTAGVGTESVVSTVLTDNRTGNIANAFGENAPFAVQPTDDMVSAGFKSLLPNAGVEVAFGLGGLGVGKGLNNVTRRIREGRAAAGAQGARAWTQENGIQVDNDGVHQFTPEAMQPAPAPDAAAPTPKADATAAPTAEPATPAPKAEPVNAKQAEDMLLGPDEDGPIYDPSLPEVDTAVQALDQLDDQRLQEAAAGAGPVLPELDRALGDQKANFQVQEGLSVGEVSAPTQNLANPAVPYEAQWQQLPNDTLLSLAAPQNSPELFAKVQGLTGLEFEEFARGDVIDGLKALQAEGQTVLPSRLQEGVTATPVGELGVDPVTFQYKADVNAQGQQKGNSLDGVTKWNTDLEQVNEVWTSPKDGMTYVVNGHNSLAKAKELGIPTVLTKEILADTPKQARTVGALSNIAKGSGTAFDAAKVIRELGIQDPAGLEAAGIPLQSGLGTQGLALSKLPDNLFQAAVNGELPMGRALALGGSGLEPDTMIRVYQQMQGRDISERGFAELVQMASSAPRVKGPKGEPTLPGFDDFIDTAIIKAELAAKVRAELTSNKNLFKKVGRNKNAAKLSEKAGTEVNTAQAQDAAGVAEAVLGEFDQTKYAAETPISQLLNDGAAEIAGGAKPDVIKKRILAQLERAAEAAPPTPKAPVEEPVLEAPAEPGPLLPDQRNELKKAVITRAIQNGEVRPSEAPLPELPDPPRDLSNPELALEDELRLADHYAQQDAIQQQVALEAQRKAIGYNDMPLEEKKANGMLDSWERPRFFHGAASEFKLEEGGEFGGDGMNIYGDGLYTTDNLGIAGTYQKKNKTRGATVNGITYEVVEKKPVKFFDLDKPAAPAVLDKLRGSAGYDQMRELVDTAIDEFEGTPSLAEVFDEMRAYSREFGIPAHEIQGTWLDFTDALKAEGYGGFTHQGGKLAGGGKTLHQVQIYWDPANSVDIYKVGPDGKRVEAGNGLTTQTAGTLDERAQLARQQLEQAKAQGDEAGAAAWQQELRQLERSRLGNAMDANATTQQDMFGVGQYDTSTPLLNEPTRISLADPAPANVSVADTFERLSKAMFESDKRLFGKADKLHGLTKRAIRELEKGDATKALQEASALGEQRAAELQTQIESIKQRAIEEGC